MEEPYEPTPYEEMLHENEQYRLRRLQIEKDEYTRYNSD